MSNSSNAAPQGYYTDTLDKHPLQDVIANIYRKTIRESNIDTHDVSSLFRYFAGASTFTYGEMYVESLGRTVTGIEAEEAYRIVIQEVLCFMQSAGLLCRDQHGWYVPTSQFRSILNEGE